MHQWVFTDTYIPNRLLKSSVPMETWYGLNFENLNSASYFQIFIYTAYINELDRKLTLNNSFVKDYAWCSNEQLDTLIDNKNHKYRNKLKTLLFE